MDGNNPNTRMVTLHVQGQPDTLVSFENLKPGDIFSLQEADGTQVDNGQRFTAASNPYLAEGDVWGIEIEEILSIDIFSR